MDMKVILAWDGDDAGREVKLATLGDDVGEVRQISQSIDNANRIWRSWVEMHGGSVISFAGDEGRAEVAADKLDELPAIRKQYGGAIGGSVSVGVGVKMSEAVKALRAAKIRGGDQIVLFTSEVEDELAAADKKDAPHDAVDKLAAEFMKKAQPALNEGNGAGIQGASIPALPSVAKPKLEGSEHSEGERMNTLMEHAPAKPEQTNASADLEDRMHEVAQNQDQQDQQQPEAQSSGNEIRAKVVSVLQQVRAAAPMLEQMAQHSPEVYQAVMSMTQVVMAMARELPHDTPDGQGLHSVAEVDAAAGLNKADEDTLTKAEIDFIIKTEALLKAGEFRGTGFRHEHTGQVIETGPFHDTEQLPNQDPFNWEAGFVDHQGRFYDRAEAAAKLKGFGFGDLETPPPEFKEDRADSLESAGYFGEQKDPTIQGMLDRRGKGYNIGGDKKVKQRLINNWKKYNTKYAPPPVKKSDVEQFLKSENGVGWKAAFRHAKTGEVMPMRGIHDPSLLPGATGDIDTDMNLVAHSGGDWEDGFVDPSGNFKTRAETYKKLRLDDSIQLPRNRIGTPEYFESQAETRKAEVQLSDLTGGSSEQENPGITSFSPKEIAKGVLVELEHTSDIKVAIKIVLDHLRERKDYYEMLEQAENKPIEKEELGKRAISAAPGIGKLPEAGAKTTREHLVLPVGSQIDSGPEGKRDGGKIKTQGADSKEKWREVRSGMVLGADGAARSSRSVMKQ